MGEIRDHLLYVPDEENEAQSRNRGDTRVLVHFS